MNPWLDPDDPRMDRAKAVVGNALYLLALATGPLAVGIVSLLILWGWQALGLPS